MIFFSPPRLLMAKKNCADALNGLATALGSTGGLFKSAVESGDTETMDNLIDAALRDYTCESNVISGLRHYCDKFGLSLGHPAASEWEYLRLIDENKEKISQILTENGF